MKLNLLFLCITLAKILSAQAFTEIPQFPPLDSVVDSSIAFSDVDEDDDPDVLITGVNNLGVLISKLYKNNSVVSSTDDVNSIVDVVFTLYPNPIKANNLNISYETNNNSWITLSVFDLNGRLLIQ